MKRPNVQADADALLRLIVGFREGDDDPEEGHHTLVTDWLYETHFKEWPIARFNGAIKWLLKTGLIEEDASLGSHPYEMHSLTATVEGRLGVQAEEEMSVDERVREVNRNARRLLALLHTAYLDAKGSSFAIVPNEETFREVGLDASTYRQAAKRLIDKGLARWSGQMISSTPEGIRVAEDASLLDYELPISDGVTEREENASMATAPDKKKVFIIHGRNTAARTAVEHFVKALKLEPLDFDQLAADMGTEFVGNIVLEGLKRAHGIVSLFTPDEYSSLAPPFRGSSTGAEILRWQSRPNVIFEAGIAFGTARDRAALVTLGEDVSLFSDVAGIHILRLNNSLESRKKFRQKLIGMGCEVDQRTDAWTDVASAGDFDAAVAGLSGVSPNDPFRP